MDAWRQWRLLRRLITRQHFSNSLFLPTSIILSHFLAFPFFSLGKAVCGRDGTSSNELRYRLAEV